MEPRYAVGRFFCSLAWKRERSEGKELAFDSCTWLHLYSSVRLPLLDDGPFGSLEGAEPQA